VPLSIQHVLGVFPIEHRCQSGSRSWRVLDDTNSVSSFNHPATEAERNAKMFAIGVLVPLSTGRLGKSWRHVQHVLGVFPIEHRCQSGSRSWRVLDDTNSVSSLSIGTHIGWEEPIIQRLTPPSTRLLVFDSDPASGQVNHTAAAYPTCSRRISYRAPVSVGISVMARAW
jgi:hypothetical protein